MIKQVIKQQKKEKDRFFSQHYIERTVFKAAENLIKNDLVKVILGPRRAGKSVFATLLLKNIDFAYLNFDDDNLANVNDSNELINGLLEIYPDVKYFFFDEIQNFRNWELFINKLHRNGYNIVLTGSNAKLLSREMSTALTGRSFDIEIYPFNFREYLQARGSHNPTIDFTDPSEKGKLQNLLEQYLINGGFPEVVTKNLEAKQYAEALFDSILLKDVIKRHRVKYTSVIYSIATYLINNYSSEFTFNKLKEILNLRSTVTVQNYLKYLEDAYLFFSLERFSFKAKEQIKSSRKIYIADNSYALAKQQSFSSNKGKLMENLVFTELLKRGYKLNLELFFYKTKNQKEIDFVLKEGYKIKELIQVCYDPSHPDVEKREVKALLEASEELKVNNLKIITWDIEKEKKILKKKIQFIPLLKWLL